MHRHYGHRLRILHWCVEQTVTNALAQQELTSAQGRILGFLERSEGASCARDIEERFHLSHPTVSGLLGRLEKKGFIELRPDEADRRCKRIYLLPRGHDCNESMFETICATEERLVEGFTEAEKETFSQMLDRAMTNMGCGSCHKEEKKHD